MALPFQPSLTVTVPVYNERDNLPRMVGDLLAYLRANAREFEILLIDDGSRDGGVDALLECLGPTPELRVVRHERNRGLTAALRTGFFGAQKDFVTWMPADGQIPAPELGKILAVWNGHDLVLSSYRRRDDGWRRTLLSRGLRLLVRLMLGFADRLEGVYVFRRALLDELALVADSSAGGIGFEIAAKIRARKLAVVSTEIECAPRMSGVSKVANTRNIRLYVNELWRIRQSMRAQKRR